MGYARNFIIAIVAVFLAMLIYINGWAADKVVVVKYELKPVAAVDSGRSIKTEWRAKLQNRASEPVSFSITIIFVDGNNNELKQETTEGQLNAKETRTFSDTLVLEMSLANKIATTRVNIDEIQ